MFRERPQPLQSESNLSAYDSVGLHQGLLQQPTAPPSVTVAARVAAVVTDVSSGSRAVVNRSSISIVHNGRRVVAVNGIRTVEARTTPGMFILPIEFVRTFIIAILFMLRERRKWCQPRIHRGLDPIDMGAHFSLHSLQFKSSGASPSIQRKHAPRLSRCPWPCIASSSPCASSRGRR